LDARLVTLLRIKIIVDKSKEVRPDGLIHKTYLAESSKESYGAKMAVLPMMIMMMITMTVLARNWKYWEY
jgi:hypothetical protein